MCCDLDISNTTISFSTWLNWKWMENWNNQMTIELSQNKIDRKKNVEINLVFGITFGSDVQRCDISECFTCFEYCKFKLHLKSALHFRHFRKFQAKLVCVWIRMQLNIILEYPNGLGHINAIIAWPNLMIARYFLNTVLNKKMHLCAFSFYFYLYKLERCGFFISWNTFKLQCSVQQWKLYFFIHWSRGQRRQPFGLD